MTSVQCRAGGRNIRVCGAFALLEAPTEAAVIQSPSVCSTRWLRCLVSRPDRLPEPSAREIALAPESGEEPCGVAADCVLRPAGFADILVTDASHPAMGGGYGHRSLRRLGTGPDPVLGRTETTCQEFSRKQAFCMDVNRDEIGTLGATRYEACLRRSSGRP